MLWRQAILREALSAWYWPVWAPGKITRGLLEAPLRSALGTDYAPCNVRRGFSASSARVDEKACHNDEVFKLRLRILVMVLRSQQKQSPKNQMYSVFRSAAAVFRALYRRSARSTYMDFEGNFVGRNCVSLHFLHKAERQAALKLLYQLEGSSRKK